jgi:hypothetical protein
VGGSWLQRAEVKESLRLIPGALLIALGAGIWAWMLASGQFAPAPVIPDPGTIAVALDTGSSAKEAGITVDVTYSASISQRVTTTTISFAQQGGSGNASNTPLTIIVLLCGAAAQNPHYTNDQLHIVSWHQAAFLDGTYFSPIGFMGLCAYTTIPLTAHDVGGTYRTALLMGYSGTPPSVISGSGVIYAWPGVTTIPSLIIGGFKIRTLPEGSTFSVNLTDPPADLSNVVASPQLSNSGILQWQGPFFGSTSPTSQYRISGSLMNRQATGQRSIFIAGALVGVAGGGVIWLLQLLSTIALAIIRPAEAATTNSAGAQLTSSASGEGRTMLPEDKEIASYLFSEKVNYLAHVNVGKLQRGFIIALLAVSAVLSFIAAVVGVSDAGKSWVVGVTLASGVIATLVLCLVPWANWRNHLRVGSDYEALYQDTLACEMGNGKVDEKRLAALRERFRDLTEEARKAEVQLGDRQIKRYENRARRELPESMRRADPELLD